MAQPITWKNVNAPQITSGIANMMSQGNQGIQEGIKGLQGLAEKQRGLNIAGQEREMDNRTQMVVRDAMASKDPEAFLANVDPNQVNMKDVLSGISAERDYRQKEYSNDLLNQNQLMMNKVFMGNNTNEQNNIIARTNSSNASTAGQLKQNSFMDENQGMKRDVHNQTSTLRDQDIYAGGEKNKVLTQQLQQGLRKGELVNTGLGIDNSLSQVKLDYAPRMADATLNQAEATLHSTELGNVMKGMQNNQEGERFRNEQSDVVAGTANKNARTANTVKQTGWIDRLNGNTLATGANNRANNSARTREQIRSNKVGEGLQRSSQAGTNNRFYAGLADSRAARASAAQRDARNFNYKQGQDKIANDRNWRKEVRGNFEADRGFNYTTNKDNRTHTMNVMSRVDEQRYRAGKDAAATQEAVNKSKAVQAGLMAQSKVNQEVSDLQAQYGDTPKLLQKKLNTYAGSSNVSGEHLKNALANAKSITTASGADKPFKAKKYGSASYDAAIKSATTDAQIAVGGMIDKMNNSNGVLDGGPKGGGKVQFNARGQAEVKRLMSEELLNRRAGPFQNDPELGATMAKVERNIVRKLKDNKALLVKK